MSTLRRTETYIYKENGEVSQTSPARSGGSDDTIKANSPASEVSNGNGEMSILLEVNSNNIQSTGKGEANEPHQFLLSYENLCKAKNHIASAKSQLQKLKTAACSWKRQATAASEESQRLSHEVAALCKQLVEAQAFGQSRSSELEQAWMQMAHDQEVRHILASV